jgi:hypothetical protein
VTRNPPPVAVFDSQSAARQFFIDKIVEQAARDGVPLTNDERQMLRWSESAPDSVADIALAERLAAAISDADYEAKIRDLLRNSVAHDAAQDPGAKDRWSAARQVLSQGDHYILIMIDDALGTPSSVMQTRIVHLAYIILTSGLLATIWYASGFLGSPTYLSIWTGALGVLTLSQLAFLTIAIRRRYWVVLALSSVTLLGLAGFGYLLATMPS